jgi:hypothetical protein
VICHQKIGGVLQGAQSLFILNIQIYPKSLQKLSGYAAGVGYISLSAQNGIKGGEADPICHNEEICNQP